MSWTETAKAEAKVAEERLESALRIYMNARDAHTAEPTRLNRISLKAAVRLVKETKAQREEWTV